MLGDAAFRSQLPVFISRTVPIALLISAVSVGATIKPEGSLLLGVVTFAFATVGLLAVWRLTAGRKTRAESVARES